MALRRKACVVRKGSAAPSRRETTPPGQWSDDGGHQALQLGPVDQLLVREAAQAQIVDAGAEAVELRFALRHQHLAVGFEAAIVVDEIVDPLPDLHGGDGQAGSRRRGARAGARRRR